MHLNVKISCTPNCQLCCVWHCFQSVRNFMVSDMSYVHCKYIQFIAICVFVLDSLANVQLISVTRSLKLSCLFSSFLSMIGFYPIQYEHAPLRVHCAMLCKHPLVDPVLSCLSCFRKPSVGVCQVVSNSPDPGIVWSSARFPPDLWWRFEEDTASIRRLIHSGYMAKQREATGLDNRGKWRLLSGMTDIFIPHEIRPFGAKNSSQAPLVQRVNSKAFSVI